VADTLGAWLRLREAADDRSRAASIVEALGSHLPSERPLRVLDLATGTGSNVRYLMPRLPSPQHWLVVDRRADLLGQLRADVTAWATAEGLDAHAAGGVLCIRGGTLQYDIESRQMDLARLHDAGLFAGCHLVTASALLDLASTSWLDALATRCRAADAAVLFTITYDGRSTCEPADADDERVRVLFNRHQRRDKGLGGPAAGPVAAGAAVEALVRFGYTVHTASSDWTIEPADVLFQRELINGWASAAVEEDPRQADVITAWLLRRLSHVDAGRSRLIVGHRDVAGWLPRPAAAKLAARSVHARDQV
jgi:hypothetical protein